MPDPADPTPVKVEARAGGWVAVDAQGRALPGQTGGQTEEEARKLADRVNKTWEAAKADRQARGAPPVTRESRDERVSRRTTLARRLLGG